MGQRDESTQWFSDVLRGYRNETLGQNGLSIEGNTIFMTRKHKHSIRWLHVILLKYELLKNVHKTDR